MMILFTQSTAVLHKYLNDELKILCSLQFFPEVAQNSLRITRVFHVQRNPWVFQVFQVCGHPAKEYMARDSEQRCGDDGSKLEWRKDYYQWSYQVETYRQLMFHIEWEELSLSLSTGNMFWNINFPDVALDEDFFPFITFSKLFLWDHAKTSRSDVKNSYNLKKPTCVHLIYCTEQNRQESPAVADKPARRLRKVCTVYVRAVGLL